MIFSAFYKNIFACAAFILVYFGNNSVDGATIMIKGNSSEYKSYAFSFYRYTDLISYNEIKLVDCITDSLGSFETTIDLPFTCQIFTYLGDTKAFLYVEPEKKYEIVLPPRSEKTLVEDLNPYFKEEEITIGIKTDDDNDINIIISSLNTTLNSFLSENFDYLYVFSDVKKVDSLENIVRTKYEKVKNAFFQDYLNYKFFFLRHFAIDRDRNYATKKYFADKPILYQNPAYMEFFNQLWGKYFIYEGLSGKTGNKIISNIVYAKSPTELKRTMSQNIALQDDAFRELVLLRGLSDCYSKSDIFPSQSVDQMLDSLIITSKYSEHKIIAKNILQKQDKPKQSDFAPDFTLPNFKGEQISLSNYNGKYIYLTFGRSENYACMKDNKLIKDIKYSNLPNLEIITISSDQNKTTFDDFVKSNPQYSWTFLYDEKKVITSKYGVKVLPSYILIDPDGRIAMTPFVSPNENFKLYYSQILKWRQKAQEAKNKN